MIPKDGRSGLIPKSPIGSPPRVIFMPDHSRPSRLALIPLFFGTGKPVDLDGETANFSQEPDTGSGKRKTRLGRRGSGYDINSPHFPPTGSGSQLQSHTMQTTLISNKFQLRQAQGKKPRLTDLKVDESTTNQRKPSQVASYASNQLQIQQGDSWYSYGSIEGSRRCLL
jgi:hypothetical protein